MPMRQRIGSKESGFRTPVTGPCVAPLPAHETARTPAREKQPWGC